MDRIATKSNERGNAVINQARQLKARGLTHAAVGCALGKSKRTIVRILRPDQRRSGRCQLCGNASQQVQQHHLDYVANIAVSLCVACHRAQHRKSESARLRAMSHMERAWLILAGRVLLGEFWTADLSTRRSLLIGLRGVNHALTRRAVSLLTEAHAPTGVSEISGITESK